MVKQYLKTLKLLYVEDDPDIREQLALFLRRRVGELFLACDGMEGLEAFCLHSPDIVITDIQMPVLDGLSMAEAIRERNNNVPIIVTTAFNDANYFLRAIDIGIDKYVLKPVKIDSLQQVLESAARAVRNGTEIQLANLVFEASLNGILVSDRNNQIIAVNQAFTDITGYTKEEVAGKTPSALQSGKHDHEFYALMWATLLSTGSWSGEIWNRHKSGELYISQQAIRVVKNPQGEIKLFVSVFSDVTSRRNREKSTEYLAYHDVLTGLPNRVLLQDRIEQAIAHGHRYKHQVAVLFADLDRFKVVNDTWGHEVGDLLLKEVAIRLGECVRDCDSVCRLGGDEFIVLLTEIEQAEDAAPVASKIIEQLSMPFVLGEHCAEIGVSIGIAIAPLHGRGVETLLREADNAMYAVKASGRNSFQYAHPVERVEN